MSTNVSLITSEVKSTFPLFSIEIVYLTVSPMPSDPSPFSITVTNLVTSIPGIGVMLTTVASLAAPVFGSSLVSVTSLL